MMRAWHLALAVALAASAVHTAGQSRPAEWPQYLGPSRNSVAPISIAPSSTLSVAWKRPIPSGAAGIIVAGSRGYTLGSDGEQDFLLAFETQDGSEAWKVALGPSHADTLMGPASTPLIAGNLIVTISSGCRMQAIDAGSRAVAWTVNFAEAFGSPLVKRGGCGMSPLLAGDRVIFTTGAPDGRLAAVDAASGRTLWRATVEPSYGGSAGWITADAGGLVLYHHVKQNPDASGVTALDPQTGAIAWRIEGTGGASGTVPVPAGAGRLLVERWPHVSLYDLATRQPVWTTTSLVAHDNPSIVHRGHIYGFGGQSGEFLTCVDASDGRVKWSTRIYRGQLALAGDTLVVLSTSAGVLRLIAADPSGYREISKLDVFRPGARTQTAPTIAGGRIFVRNYEEIVGVQVNGS